MKPALATALNDYAANHQATQAHYTLSPQDEKILDDLRRMGLKVPASLSLRVRKLLKRDRYSDHDLSVLRIEHHTLGLSQLPSPSNGPNDTRTPAREAVPPKGATS
jgi:hypothetical protein